jgi:adenylate cyclase
MVKLAPYSVRMARDSTPVFGVDDWRAFLEGTLPTVRVWRRVRQVSGRIPRSPRCKTCQAPFEGPFKTILALLGKEPFAKNPRYCRACYRWLTEKKGGAEVQLSMLFADVRGSTPLGERVGATNLAKVMDRFYSTGVDILIRHDALVERFMGDQVVGYFFPGFAGPNHARAAIRAGLELLRATGHTPGEEPWVPVGVGVHTGEAFVGTVGTDILEFTAMGEEVNLAARLASAAAAGELVASDAVFEAAGMKTHVEKRQLQLKGVSSLANVRILDALATVPTD